MRDGATMIVALTITIYWVSVVGMAIWRWARKYPASGLVPKTLVEWAVWPLWTAVIAAWIVLPYRALRSSRYGLALPEWTREIAWLHALRWCLAAVAVVCLLMTVRCWIRMGRNWSVVVLPGVKTELVTTGLFAWVRHPIYALSILMMACTVGVVPIPALALMGLLHLGLMHFKARNEERFLLSLHGPRYAAYCARTGRFMPRWRMLTNETMAIV